MKRSDLKSFIREEIISTLSEDKNDDKISKYESYTYTLDGKVVKPEIAFYNNILKAELDGELYRLEEPVNGKIELNPIKGKTGMYTEDVAYQVTGTSGKAVQSFKNDQEARDFDAKASNVTVKKLEESPNDLIEKIKNFTLIDPAHIELLRSGYGEFPDSYKFTDNGAKEIANLLSSESNLEEMARAKVSYALNIDKAQELKNIIDMAKGNVKKALEYLLDKETMSVADVAKELGLKDTASINNPKFRELMNALKEKGVVSLVGSSEAPKEKPSKEKAAIKSVEKDMETGEEEADDYYKADDEDSTPEETDIDKQAAKAANKLTKRTSKLDKVLKGLIQVEKEMKELAGEYQNAEGEEKANIVAKLKEKTAQKKELEALKDKFEFDVV